VRGLRQEFHPRSNGRVFHSAAFSWSPRPEARTRVTSTAYRQPDLTFIGVFTILLPSSYKLPPGISLTD
jgi:hypothetical protein